MLIRITFAWRVLNWVRFPWCFNRLALLNPSNTLDQYAVMVDHQNFLPGQEVVLTDVMSKRLEQYQCIRCSREVRPLTNELRLSVSSLLHCSSDRLAEFVVHPDDPNEQTTEHWQEGLHDWYTCVDTRQWSNNSTNSLNRRLRSYLHLAKHQKTLFVSQTPFLHNLSLDKQTSPLCEGDSHSV